MRKRTHSRRHQQRIHRQIEACESRQLLAGVVGVNLRGNNLVVTGDGEDNSVLVNLNAYTAEELVVGLNGTEVELGDFRYDYDKSIRDLRVRMRSGNDTLIVDAAGRRVGDDVLVSLGTGSNTFIMFGGDYGEATVRDDVRIRGSYGTDSVFLANVEVGDDLGISTSSANDAVVLHNVKVKDRSKLNLAAGTDGLLIGGSEFHDDVKATLGIDDDYAGLLSTTFGDRVRFTASRGNDSLFSYDVYGDSIRMRGVENELDSPNANGEATHVLAPLRTALYDAAPDMNHYSANDLHDALRDVAYAFDADLVSLDLDPASQTVSVNDPTPTVSVLWDQAAQDAVSNTKFGPTVAARAYAMMHTAMYDAWSAYDDTAISTLSGDDYQQPYEYNTYANKAEAMSYAAFAVLDDLFAAQSSKFEELMYDLGYDPSYESTDTDSPAGIGNKMAETLLSYRYSDGANQLGDDPNGTSGVPYSDTTGYASPNDPGSPRFIDRWTEEYVPIDATPGNEHHIQQFLTPHWSEVTPFSLSSADQFRPVAPEPFLLVDGEVDLEAKTITLPTGSVLDIDKSLIGTVINPAFISQAEEVVSWSANLNDEQKLIAEFWEDAGGTSFPPGTFLTFGEFVSARDNHSIDDDAQMFFALANSGFDAGIATWEAKVHYDYVRPVRAIRELGALGLIGEFNADLGGYAIDAWSPGEGTQTILATDFLTYQTPGGDPSPPFAEYTSGHSTFSAAAAEVLYRFKGSDYFGGSVTFPVGSSRFEPGETPTEEVMLSWNTFSAAADEAGASRRYGGIHFLDGDINGRTMGRDIGYSVWEQAQYFINGGGEGSSTT